MKKFSFEGMKIELDKATKCADGSEIKHLIEFLKDIVDNVEYDVEQGSYAGVEKAVLKQQLLGSLDELRASCDTLETKVKELLK
jgi:hypothetical protein